MPPILQWLISLESIKGIFAFPKQEHANLTCDMRENNFDCFTLNRFKMRGFYTLTWEFTTYSHKNLVHKIAPHLKEQRFMMLTTRLKNTSYKVLAALYHRPQQWCFITASTLFYGTMDHWIFSVSLTSNFGRLRTIFMVSKLTVITRWNNSSG